MAKDLNKVQILKLIKPKLTMQHTRGICALLTGIANNYSYSRKTQNDARSLRNWIMSLLGEYGYYDGWLCNWHLSKVRYLTRKSKLSSFDHRKYHEGRKQWIDWMIKIHEDAYAIANGKKPVNNIIHTLNNEYMRRYKDESYEF